MDSRSNIGRHEDGRVAEGVYRIKDIFVNCYVIKNPDDNSWVLVDAGLRTAENKIKKLVAHVMGRVTAPKAIILTHGHFDHIGSLKNLLKNWNVPVYAHPLEAPFLTGQLKYPPPDPSVGGGMMSAMSGLYPRNPIDVSSQLKLLPPDGRIPGLNNWRSLHTPGHTPGHISLYRESDRLLIAGDAFVATRQESLSYVMSQKMELNGPPKYFTPDWHAAEDSVSRLAALDPDIAATGHGMPMYGDALRSGLRLLGNNFEKMAVPRHGKYAM